MALTENCADNLYAQNILTAHNLVIVAHVALTSLKGHEPDGKLERTL